MPSISHNRLLIFLTALVSLAGVATGHLLKEGATLQGLLAVAVTCGVCWIAAALGHSHNRTTADGRLPRSKA